MRSFALILVSALLVAFGAAGALAQDADTSRTLPDIAPQEVEIRGQLDVAFPSLERQPLVGFNPPPSTYRVPESRVPYMETYKQKAADLPASPLQQPELPAADRAALDRTGFLEAALGRHFDRRGRLHLRVPVGSGRHLFTNLDYAGSEGTRPFDHESASRYDRFDGRLGLESRSAGWMWTARLDGFYDRYALFGAAGALAGYPDQPVRQNAGATGTFTLRERSVRPTSLTVDYHAGRFETGIDTSGGELLHRERRLSGDGTWQSRLGGVDLQIDGSASTSGLDEASVLGDDLLTYDGGVGLSWAGRSGIHLEGGVRAIGYRASPVNGNAERAYLAPQLRVRVRPTGQFELYARNVPELSTGSLYDLFRTSPYLVPEPVLQPSVAPVRAEAGLHHYLGDFHYNLHAGLAEYEVYRFFQHAVLPPGGYRQGFVRPGYRAARILELGGSISYHRPGGLQAQVSVAARRGRLTSSDTRIPYFAPLSADLSLTLPFADERGRLTASAEVRLGDRTTAPAGGQEIGGYVDLDSRISYRILDPLALFVDVDNVSMGDLERWNHYPQPTYIGRGGFELHW